MNGYDAIASYLYQAVEDRYLGPEFEFGNSRIGPTEYISNCREVEAVREFIHHHDDAELWDWIHDMANEVDARDFVCDAERCLVGYLLSLSEFREDATQAYRGYAAAIAEGKRIDDQIKEEKQRPTTMVY